MVERRPDWSSLRRTVSAMFLEPLGPSDSRELVYELDVSRRQRVTLEVEARFVNLRAQTLEAVQLLPQAPPELLSAIQSIE